MESAFLLVIVAIAILISGIFVLRVVASNAADNRLNDKLDAEVELVSEGSSQELAVVVQDLKKQRVGVYRNADKLFPAASLVKVPIAVLALKACQDGKFNLNDIVVIRRKDIAGGSGLIKTMKFPAKMSFKGLLELMIAKSDNTATNKVIDILGYDYINTGFIELGLKNTALKRKMMDFSQRSKGVENYTCASDMALVLEKIYRKEVLDEETCDLLISFLKKQKYNDRIPHYLPSVIEIAHKTGLERGVVHDIGIVYLPSRDYIICILVKGVKNYRRAKDFIARVSLSVYDVYKNR